MLSPSTREASETCCRGCCPNPFLGFPDYHHQQHSHVLQAPRSPATAAAARHEFKVTTTSSLFPNAQFTNHESLPSLHDSFNNFTEVFPQYLQTDQADQIRAQYYFHLSLNNHVCFDYIGHGLFSYPQLLSHSSSYVQSSASTSSSPSPSVQLEPPFFYISYRSVNLNSWMQYGGEESELESKIRKRIFDFTNISEDDYTLVFTANQSSAFKLLAESYPFNSNTKLLTVYDHENEAAELMIESSKKHGARVSSAEFSWPKLRIKSGKLMKTLVGRTRKKKKMGLFVFPLQSKVTGVRYAYTWMSLAQENGWHVLLDATALGPKDMDTLGLSLFEPEFLFYSFYKIFGENPSGFGCLFVKKSSASVLRDSSSGVATTMGIVSLVPHMTESMVDPHEAENITAIRKEPSFSEIVELETLNESSQSKIPESSTSVGNSRQLECQGLDHADALGLILLSNRVRYLINWLVNALMSLHHPYSETRIPLIRIYGPKVMFNRGPSIAFNVFDWNGTKIDPALVQKLADRHNISLSCGFLQHIFFSDKYEQERVRVLETRSGGTNETHSGVSVVTAALGFLTNFEDVYRIWSFVSRFLDADFVEKERWRYMALNQKTIEI